MPISHKKPPGAAQGHRAGKQVALLAQPGTPAPVPDPPAGLLAKSREIWAAFWSSPVAVAVDRQADVGRLERWISAVDEHQRASRAFRKERLVEGSQHQPVLNPLASYLATLEQTIAKAEQQFGMTPLARMQLGIAYGEAHRSLAELNAEVDRDDDDAADPRADLGLVIDAEDPGVAG